ncbi:MAG: DUF2071 domain-containing protein [Bacteroidetes bacterium]|nr:DUF2071 domain-containing protein [Bacteroidota bacterium]
MKTFLTAKWENLIMANYVVEPQVLKPFLPKGVELDLHEGEAFVSLVGFMFNRSRIFNVPIPLLGTFEEINLRFYVKRKTADGYRRGVVFINETVPYKPVAWLANKLYKEHYIAIPTQHNIVIGSDEKLVQYNWKMGQTWNKMAVKASKMQREMSRGSLEEFIFEHYYGYTRIDANRSQEYRIHHPRWKVNDVLEANIQCNFAEMYGAAFAQLSSENPKSVIIAEGSAISVDWNRKPI